MALRLSKSIVRGGVDNRVEGHVAGELWLHDREHPVVLELNENCLRDIAGCRVEIHQSPRKARTWKAPPWPTASISSATAYTQELYAIREEMLKLMQRFPG